MDVPKKNGRTGSGVCGRFMSNVNTFGLRGAPPSLVVAVPAAARAIPYKLAHHVGDDVLTVNLACLGTWQTSEASLL